MTSPLIAADALGRSGQFGELRQLLQSADYGDEFLCRRFHLQRAEDFEIDRRKRAPLPVPESEADLLATLFLAGEIIEQNTVRHFLGAGKMALLEGMGLLRHEPQTAQCCATAALYPVGDLYIASDRWSAHDGSQFSVPEDIVYPAFIPNTRLFLRHLPERPCGRFLDLCGGTGVAALMAARSGAEQAYSGDISDRSTLFAEFNRQLNGVSNAQAVTSDLYQNFTDCRFDAISAHPPYVPTLQPKWVFFSGGRDGEEITRRIVEGLSDHLNDGGVFLALTMGTDRVDRPFEHRVREWLGAGEKDFDVAFLARKELDPQEFALRANRETVRSLEESERWSALFKSLQITSLAYGFICIQRRSGAQKTFTVRRQASPSKLRAPWEWLLRWESTACIGEVEQLLLDSPLHASLQTEFVVRHRLDEGLWNPLSYTLRTEDPFNMECNAKPWMAHLISLCDGKATGREALKILIQNEALPKSTPPGEFARAAASLVSGGFIEVEGFRLPRAVK
jgi:methylase of polypeptide subunit release factors